MKKRNILFAFLCITNLAFAQWEKVENTGIVGRITSMYTTPDLMYITGDGGVFSSTDGKSWNFDGGGSYNGYYFASGVTANDTSIIESSSYGVFYSKNKIWKVVGNGVGLPDTKYDAIVASGDKVYVKGSGAIYSFSKADGIWRKEILPNSINTLSSNGKDVLVGFSNYHGAYRYDKGSSAWVFMDVFKDEVVNEFFQKGDTILSIYKKAADSIAVSKDNGKNWIKNATPAFSYYQNSMEFYNNILFHYSSVGFNFSMDYGLNWTTAEFGFKDKWFRKIKIFKEYIYASSPDNTELYRRKISQLFGIIYNGQGQLEAINIKNATYQWYINEIPIIGATGRALKALKNGIYKVEITYENGSHKMSDSKVLSYKFQVSDLLTSSANSYTDGSRICDITYDRQSQIVHLNSLESNLPDQIEVYNMIGQNIMKLNEAQISSVDLSELQSGLYIMKLYSNKNLLTFKLYKE